MAYFESFLTSVTHDNVLTLIVGFILYTMYRGVRGKGQETTTNADERAVIEAANTARRYLDPILLEPLAEIGLLVKDKVVFWRLNNQANMVLKAKKLLESKGVTMDQLTHKVELEHIIPLIEGAGMTDNETLSDMFAGLLATTIQEDAGEYMHKSYIQLLHCLSSLDASILMKLKLDIEESEDQSIGDMIKVAEKPYRITHRDFGFEPDMLDSPIYSSDQIKLSFENIRRLGICDRGKDSLDVINRKDKIIYTDYGWSFMTACIKDIKDVGRKGR